jgi:hypothetical protein
VRHLSLKNRFFLILNIILLLCISNILCAGIKKDSITPLPTLNKKFLIVAHVALDGSGAMGITEISIRNSIGNLNNYWNKIGVSFELCELKTIANYRYDTLISQAREQELLANFVIPDRINIFYVDSIKDAAGKASLGGITSSTNVGIWLEKGSTGAIIHEMGHFWGLKHTFDNDIPENPDHSNCATAGDGVCDTPVDPYIKSLDEEGYYLNYSCVFINKDKDANGNYFDPDAFNIMSYYSCGTCMKFTNGQYIKMVETYSSKKTKW